MQYVGSRYVPKFMGTYDPTQAYEVLCVVDNGLGTSYISKIPTPAGTPLTDNNYWALYGTSNGAIYNLQNQIDMINNAFVTPEMFGAVGDGVTDDTQALSDCMQHKFVIMPHKTYKISSTIDVYSNIIISEGTTINYSGSWTTAVFNVLSDTDFHIDNVTINANYNASYCIFANDLPIPVAFDNVVVTNCTALNTNNDTSGDNSSGIFIYRDNYNVVVSNNTCKNMHRNSSTPGTKASSGVHVSKIYGACLISNNVIDGILYESGTPYDADGIEAYAANAVTSTKETASITIANNYIHNCQGRFIKVQGEAVKVMGNVCKNDSLEIAANFTGIDMQTAGGIVTENTIKIDGYTLGTEAHFLTVAGHDYTKLQMSGQIANNYFYASTPLYIGMLLYGAETVDSLLNVTGNSIEGATTVIDISGENTQTSNTYVTICNNIFGTHTNAIYVKPAIAALIEYLSLNNIGGSENFISKTITAPNTVTTPKDLLDYIESNCADKGTTEGVCIWTGVGQFAYSVIRRDATHADVILYYQGAKIYRLWLSGTPYYFEFSGAII